MFAMQAGDVAVAASDAVGDIEQAVRATLHVLFCTFFFGVMASAAQSASA